MCSSNCWEVIFILCTCFHQGYTQLELPDDDFLNQENHIESITENENQREWYNKNTNTSFKGNERPEDLAAAKEYLQQNEYEYESRDSSGINADKQLRRSTQSNILTSITIPEIIINSKNSQEPHKNEFSVTPTRSKPTNVYETIVDYPGTLKTNKYFYEHHEPVYESTTTQDADENMIDNRDDVQKSTNHPSVVRWSKPTRSEMKKTNAFNLIPSRSTQDADENMIDYRDDVQKSTNYASVVRWSKPTRSEKKKTNAFNLIPSRTTQDADETMIDYRDDVQKSTNYPSVVRWSKPTRSQKKNTNAFNLIPSRTKDIFNSTPSEPGRRNLFVDFFTDSDKTITFPYKYSDMPSSTLYEYFGYTTTSPNSLAEITLGSLNNRSGKSKISSSASTNVGRTIPIDDGKTDKSNQYGSDKSTTVMYEYADSSYGSDKSTTDFYYESTTPFYFTPSHYNDDPVTFRTDSKVTVKIIEGYNALLPNRKGESLSTQQTIFEEESTTFLFYEYESTTKTTVADNSLPKFRAAMESDLIPSKINYHTKIPTRTKLNSDQTKKIFTFTPTRIYAKFLKSANAKDAKLSAFNSVLPFLKHDISSKARSKSMSYRSKTTPDITTAAKLQPFKTNTYPVLPKYEVTTEASVNTMRETSDKISETTSQEEYIRLSTEKITHSSHEGLTIQGDGYNFTTIEYNRGGDNKSSMKEYDEYVPTIIPLTIHSLATKSLFPDTTVANIYKYSVLTKAPQFQSSGERQKQQNILKSQQKLDFTSISPKEQMRTPDEPNPPAADEPSPEGAVEETTSTNSMPKFDLQELMALIANLTLDYETNITHHINESLQKYSIPTCKTSGKTTTTTDPMPLYQGLPTGYGLIISKCFVCGLDERGIPYDANCADAFAGDFLPLIPVDPTARGKLSKFRKYCRFKDTSGIFYNVSDPRSVYGRWTGGCSVRWNDISGVYTQRTCRNRYRAIIGKHFASKRMAKLEMALSGVDEGCISSPSASLIPLSRGISLFAKFHACVCSGNWCNTSSRHRFNQMFLYIISIFIYTLR